MTSNVFLAGHASASKISSSNFPRFDRNPNTGRPFAEETDAEEGAISPFIMAAAAIRRVLLPVIPARADVPARELTSASGARYGAKRNVPVASESSPDSGAVAKW